MRRTINIATFITIVLLAIASCKSTDPYNGHEYVDLGLSVKWATCNIGAEKPEDGGSLFAWGETQPKDKYTWATYKHCKGSNKTLTKYCFDSSYGTVDNKTVLDKSDDAAHVNWGGKWRTPTYAEFEELYENCTWHTKTVNDVSGYEVKSKINGKSIFLPSLPNPGVGNDESTAFYVDCGFYWFSSLIEDIPGSAYSFFFCTIDSNMNHQKTAPQISVGPFDFCILTKSTNKVPTFLNPIEINWSFKSESGALLYRKTPDRLQI